MFDLPDEGTDIVLPTAAWQRDCSTSVEPELDLCGYLEEAGGFPRIELFARAGGASTLRKARARQTFAKRCLKPPGCAWSSAC